MRILVVPRCVGWSGPWRVAGFGGVATIDRVRGGSAGSPWFRPASCDSLLLTPLLSVLHCCGVVVRAVQAPSAESAPSLKVAGGAVVQDHLPDKVMGGAAVQQDQASDEVSLAWPLLAAAVAA